ncbi:MAG: class II aldolase, partial [Armatimonadota bacterium]
MNSPLRHLISISRTVGGDASLVQGGGGNTSVKSADGRYMYIKASGTALKDMSARNGWRRLNLDCVLAILDDDSLGGLPAADREAGVISRLRLACEDDVPGEARPSVESHLHALLGRCVVHLHPVAVGAFACAKNGRAEVERLFAGEEFPPLWVPYADPGYRLALKIRRLTRAYERRHGRRPAMVFLEKHGLLVSADAPRAALAEVRRAVAVCGRRAKLLHLARVKPPPREEVTGLKLAVRRAYFEATGRRVSVKHFSSGEIAGFLARPDAKKLLAA